MRILITNLSVANSTGSEAVVELLADGLRMAGHETMLLAPMIGGLADRMRRRGHQVVERIAEITEKPDVIHAQHLTPCLTALARFPDVPAVYSCHSAFYEIEVPMPHPQIRHWIAVDEACKARCLSRGVPADRLSLIHNAVDLQRFMQRPPLPPKPAKGLLLTKNFEHQQAVREACTRSGIQLDELGPATGRFSVELEKDLIGYDIVFATARMAIEAAAVGCSVIVCDARGFAGMLNTTNMEAWRRMNLGAGLLARPTTVDNLMEAISSFDASDAATVCTYFRKVAGAVDFVEEHLNIYNQAIRTVTDATPDQISLANACWIEEIAISPEHRRWFKIAKELNGWQDASEQTLILDLLKSNTNTAETSHATLRNMEAHLSGLSNFVSEWKRLYNGMIPLFVRKLLLKARRRA